MSRPALSNSSFIFLQIWHVTAIMGFRQIEFSRAVVVATFQRSLTLGVIVTVMFPFLTEVIITEVGSAGWMDWIFSAGLLIPIAEESFFTICIFSALFPLSSFAWCWTAYSISILTTTGIRCFAEAIHIHKGKETCAQFLAWWNAAFNTLDILKLGQVVVSTIVRILLSRTTWNAPLPLLGPFGRGGGHQE